MASCDEGLECYGAELGAGVVGVCLWVCVNGVSWSLASTVTKTKKRAVITCIMFYNHSKEPPK